MNRLQGRRVSKREKEEAKISHDFIFPMLAKKGYVFINGGGAGGRMRHTVTLTIFFYLFFVVQL